MPPFLADLLNGYHPNKMSCPLRLPSKQTPTSLRLCACRMKASERIAETIGQQGKPQKEPASLLPCKRWVSPSGNCWTHIVTYLNNTTRGPQFNLSPHREPALKEESAWRGCFWPAACNNYSFKAWQRLFAQLCALAAQCRVVGFLLSQSNSCPAMYCLRVGFFKCRCFLEPSRT